VALQKHGYPRVTVNLELILRRKLPRDLGVAPVVQHLYLETWDALQAET